MRNEFYITTAFFTPEGGGPSNRFIDMQCKGLLKEGFNVHVITAYGETNEKFILDNYIFCYHEKFKNPSLFSILKNLKGLKYFLTNSQNNQKEIINFIELCKKNQDENGYIKQSFFNFTNLQKGIFLNGPFTNMIFSVIENQKDKLKVLIGNVTTTISSNTGYLYRSV